MKLRPLFDRLVVRPDAADTKSKGGIIIPETSKDKPSIGIVLTVGPGKLLKSGKYRTIDIKEGDRVIFSKGKGIEYKEEDETFLVLREDDIIGIK